MKSHNLPCDFLKLLKSVEAKRARTVINHVLQHGQITTEELKDVYGYNHPPRAIRDVREHGIPIDTYRVTGSDGRRIGAYKFGDPSKVRAAQLSGRTALGTRLKLDLMAKFGPRCNIYLEQFPERELQIDHRIPFEIAGEPTLSDDLNDYMLLCPSANRAKSWSCEHCNNWQQRDPGISQTCYWAYPEDYKHVAMRDLRRLDILWSGNESLEYERLKDEALHAQKAIPEYVKDVLRSHFVNRKGEVK